MRNNEEKPLEREDSGYTTNEVEFADAEGSQLQDEFTEIDPEEEPHPEEEPDPEDEEGSSEDEEGADFDNPDDDPA